MSVTLTTERLTLRLPKASDLPACTAFWSSDRSHMMGGPWTADQTALEFADVLTQWQKHGFSLFIVTLKGSDAPIGLIGPFFPDDYFEPELGWSLWDATLEGQGLAYEAAAAARDWFFANTAYKTAVSYTHPDNTRSHRLCEKLGAVLDPDARSPYPPPEVIYRHHAPQAGTITPWTAPVPQGAQALAQSIAAQIPTLTTPRTTLRAARLSDFDAWLAIVGSDRAQHIGGPSTPAQAWFDFGSNIANWLLRGHGLWTVTDHAGSTLGFVQVDFEPGDTEHELAWFLSASAEGQGYMTEAATAARDHATQVLRLPSLVSYIAPANLRSAALAARIGAVKDSVLDGWDVWRHHPKRAA